MWVSWPASMTRTAFLPASSPRLTARPALWALYAFNHELVRARETVREPMMAMIRLQWWREVVEGEAKRHEVATPLRDAIDAGTLRQSDLLALIEAREYDPPEDEDDDWAAFVGLTAGTLAVAAAPDLGEAETAGVRAAGAAYGAAGLLRNRALAGESPISALSEVASANLATVRGTALPRSALAAVLPAVFAARDLKRERPVQHRALGDKLAVTVAAFTGRI